MGCERCVHTEELRKLFQCCQNCPSHGARCATCDNYVRRKAAFAKIDHYCQNCDAGKLHGTVHFDGAPGGMATVVAQAGGIAVDAIDPKAATSGVTALDDEIEDKLRVILSTLVQLEPLELLLVRHAFWHRPMASFRDTARELRDRLNRYDLSKASNNWSANVYNWEKRIVSQVPALADLFEAVKNETAGSAK